MFSRVITSLPPWTDDGMFDRVTGNGFRDSSYGSDNDYSVIAIAKALLSRRLPEGEVFAVRNFTMAGEHPSEGLIESLNNIMVQVIETPNANPNDLQNKIVFIQCKDSSEDEFELIKKAVEDQFMSQYAGWDINHKVETFLGKQMKARVVFNKENGSAIVFTMKLTMPMWHLLGAVIAAYVPKFFDKIPLTDEEKAAMRAAAVHGASDFTNAMAALEKEYDIRGMKIRTQLGGFERRQREQQVRVVESNIRAITDRMESLSTEYAEQAKRLDEANIKRNGLKYCINGAGDDEKLINFFQKNACLDLVDVSGPEIDFIVRTYYEVFSQDEYEGFRTNDSWFDEIRRSSTPFSSADNCRKIMDAMFIDKTIKLKICGYYSINIAGSVTSCRSYTYPDSCREYIPNAHLQKHNCLGNYLQMIESCLKNGDTIGAINCCITSAKSVNITESGMTFNPMMREVFGSSKKCFELPDGTCVTPAEALEWVNKQSEKQSEEVPANETDHPAT